SRTELPRIPLLGFRPRQRTKKPETPFPRRQVRRKISTPCESSPTPLQSPLRSVRPATRTALSWMLPSRLARRRCEARRRRAPRLRPCVPTARKILPSASVPPARPRGGIPRGVAVESASVDWTPGRSVVPKSSEHRHGRLKRVVPYHPIAQSGDPSPDRPRPAKRRVDIPGAMGQPHPGRYPLLACEITEPT